MKKLVCFLIVLATTPAFASESKIELIKQNLEVKNAIKSFEKNRSEKCVAISQENTRISKSGEVKAVVTCNQYNEQGEPQANVYAITIRGAIYGSFFELNSISFVGVE